MARISKNPISMKLKQLSYYRRPGCEKTRGAKMKDSLAILMKIKRVIQKAALPPAGPD